MSDFISVPSESLGGGSEAKPLLTRNHIFHSARLYHGTSAQLKPGDELSPDGAGHTFSTPNIEEAKKYAKDAAEKSGKKHSGYVYMVEPAAGDRHVINSGAGHIKDKSGKPYIVSKEAVKIKTRVDRGE